MPGEGFILDMIISLKNNALLRKKRIANSLKNRITKPSTTEYINNNGPSDDALETHLKELKKQEKSEKIKESLVLLALLLLILIVVYGAIESFSRLM